MAFGGRHAMAAAFALTAALTDRETYACGGCLQASTESTVVTDHRIAFAVSKTQTVLWDQIRYSGSPREFAWVLPVRAGARVELSNEAFFTALETNTQPRIYGPRPFRPASGCSSDMGCSADSPAVHYDPDDAGVEVVAQSVVGPYETATLRATDDNALVHWLDAHGYAIPPDVEPTIGAYVTEGFDFVALRLLPDASVRAMQPVRVVTKGGDPTLPLRMIAAGAGARVGITLWVLAESAMQPQNFPVDTFEVFDDRLRWFGKESRSNYAEASLAAMAQANGRTWLVESAQGVFLPMPRPWSMPDPTDRSYYPIPPSPRLVDAYFEQCAEAGGARPVEDAGRDDDAGEDAGEDAGVDAGLAGISIGGRSPSPEPLDVGDLHPSSCAGLDDLDVAVKGMSGGLVVTRLRAFLPKGELGEDLRLGAGGKIPDASGDAGYPRPVPSSNIVQIRGVPELLDDEDDCRVSPGSRARQHGPLLVAFAFLAVAVLRRRRW